MRKHLSPIIYHARLKLIVNWLFLILAVNNDVSEANEKTEESTKDANKEDASVKMETGDVKVESDGDASKLDTEKENEIVTPQTEADIGTVKSETEGDAMETDGEKLPEGEKSETVSDGGTEKTEVEADGKSKEEETGTSDGTGTTETVDKEGAEKTEMDTSEKKGEEESAAKLEDEIQKIDIPFPESFMKCKFYFLLKWVSLNTYFSLVYKLFIRGKNEIVSLQTSFHICFTLTDCSDTQHKFR